MTDHTERNQQIIEMYDGGLTFAEIGERFGITGNRAGAIYRTTPRVDRTKQPPAFVEKKYDWDKIKRDMDRALFPARGDDHE